MRPIFEDAIDNNTIMEAYINTDNLLYLRIEDHRQSIEDSQVILLDFNELNVLIKHLQKCSNELKDISNHG